MSAPFEDTRLMFSPLAFDERRMAELGRAMTKAIVALDEYAEWRRRHSMPPSKVASFWCFTAANAETPELREHIVGWLDGLTGLPS